MNPMDCDPLCEVCAGYPGVSCTCPECDVCGVVGDPGCINTHMPIGLWPRIIYGAKVDDFLFPGGNDTYPPQIDEVPC